MDSKEFKSSIDAINSGISKLHHNGIQIVDWYNPGDWALSKVECSEEENKVYFRVEEVQSV